MTAQRRQLLTLAFSLLLLGVGVEGVLPDGWGLFGDPNGQIAAPTHVEPTSRPAEKPLHVWARFTLASRDRLAVFLKQIGSERPAQSVGFTPHSGPFASGDVIDPSFPSGQFFVAADSRVKGPIFAVPVKPGTVPLTTFADLTTVPLPGHPDILCTGTDVGYRRTGHFLFMGGTPETLLGFDDQTFADYSDPTLLVTLKADFETLRNNSFWNCHDVITFWAKALEPDLVSPGRVYSMIQRDVDSFDLSVHVDKQAASVHINAAAPGARAPSVRYPRPALPGECFARFDFVSGLPEQRAATVEAFYDELSRNYPDLMPGTADERKAIVQSIVHALPLLVGDATSLGIARDGSDLTFVAVNQYAEPKDLLADIALFRQNLARDFSLGEDNLPVAQSTYDDGTFHVIRLGATAGDWYMDFIQQGKTVFVSLAADDAHRVARLAALQKKTTEDMPLFAGSCTMSELNKYIESIPPVVPFPDVLRQAAAQHAQDGTVSVEIRTADRNVTLHATFPPAFLAPALKLIP
jgi:hypothetical protein